MAKVVEVIVPDAEFRVGPTERILWDAVGSLFREARERGLPTDMIYSVMLSRIMRELRQEHGLEAAIETVAGLLATMREASQHDR
jgi:hypothetical protein